MAQPPVHSAIDAPSGDTGTLAAAATAAGTDPAFVDRYLRHLDVDAIGDLGPAALVELATTHRRIAGSRAPGETIVEVIEGVVHIVTEDRPFLVDSVLGALADQGLGVSLLLHPVFVVRRGERGELLEVVDAEPQRGHEVSGQVDESWMRLEFTERCDLALVQERVSEVIDAVAAAVDDGPAMRKGALALAEALTDGRGQGSAEEQASAATFLRWLVDGHFVFIGSRDHHLKDDHGRMDITAIPGSGMGMLRDDSTAESITPLGGGPGHREGAQSCLSIGKSAAVLPVQRVTHPDLVAVRFHDEQGRVVERRWAGLFASTAYTNSVLTIPLIADKVEEVLADVGWVRESHSGAFALRLLESFPRDELFQAPVGHLREVVVRIQQMAHQMRTATFLRLDSGGQFVTAIVYLPRDRYTTQVRLRIEERLCEATGADEVSFTAHVSDEPMARLYYILRGAKGVSLPEGDAQRELDDAVADAPLTWQERLVRAAEGAFGVRAAKELLDPWRDGFPLGYQEDFDAAQAVADLKNLVRLGQGTPFACVLYDPRRGHGRGGDDPCIRRFKLFSIEELILDELMPIFRDLGVRVIEEEPYTLTRDDGLQAGIYDFSLRVDDHALWLAHSHQDLRDLVETAVRAVRAQRTESDRFNALIIRAGLTWRQVSLLRAIGRYLLQLGGGWGQKSLESALVEHPGIAADLVELFEVRFDPDRWAGTVGPERETAQQEVIGRIDAGLEEVSSLGQDRIIRAFVGVITAVLRTNYFVTDDSGEPLTRMSFKLAPAEVPDMPKPHPAYEIWVHSPREEGVHLRFGAVSRGGLRWSDRRDDFRTEVLGLVKAQMVKNAVIVPTGSKGGFYAKQLPDPGVDRDAWLTAARSAYRSFVSGLLDVTDNRVDGAIVPPPQVVRHDDDDSYLVVAADKGTAAFSDLANSIAREYGFWLDDAFASGGSVGYDHKGMGITARGAWESVKRHFREVGQNTQAEDFTVVGIGDMSGDVFGNGMLRTEHIRLVAAFNHLHVFIDPEPDAASAYVERRRLFELPRSTWDDYDRSLISEGGGVWPRSAKSVPVSEHAARALGLDGATSLPPNELIHLILQAPVDLLWNGGIGTYVKAGAESHVEVGDRANDAIRVDGAMLRTRVMGEGGNLGATQRGRIEAAGTGVRINTDAIDNSAGVDTSDREVNIKILLGEAIRRGSLDEESRVELLASMTDEVADQVLRDNYEQNVLLGNARAQGGQMLVVHERLMSALVERGDLDRELEFLPGSAEVHDRAAAGKGLSSPELSVLLAYSKLALKADLLESDLPDDPATERQLREYFPTPLRERFDEDLAGHPLRREIVTTEVANDLVNRGGITFVQRAVEETGATVVQVARAFLVSRQIFGLDGFVARVEELDNVVPTAVQTRLYLELRRLMDRAVRWFLTARPGRLQVIEEIDRFGETLTELAPLVPEFLRGSETDRFERKAGELMNGGVPTDLARDAASLLDQYSLLDIVDLAHDGGRTAQEVAEAYYLISEAFGVDELLILVTRLPREQHWDGLARAALRDDLYAALQSLTRSVLDRDGADARERFQAWSGEHDEALERVNAQLAAIRQVAAPGVAALSVALRTLRSVTR